MLHKANGSVRTLNLVQGECAYVESPEGLFDPFEVHYAETFIVPDAAGDFTVRPAAENPEDDLVTIEASVR